MATRKKSAKEAKANPPLRQRVYEEPLGCNLTDDEVADRAAQCARKIAEIDRTEEERKLTAGEFRDQLKSLHLGVRELSRAVRERREVRPVELEVWLRPETGLCETVRLDTGEVVYSRKMTESERQMNLFPLEAGEQAPA